MAKKLIESSAVVTRTEKSVITVKHPPDWTEEQVTAAMVERAEEIDAAMGEIEDVTFRVKKVTLGGDDCDYEEWDSPDLTKPPAPPDDDDDDDDDDSGDDA